MGNTDYLKREKAFILHKNGVHLDSTLMVWARPIISNGVYGEWKRMKRELLVDNFISYEYISSPNFIELFSALPKYINSQKYEGTKLPLALGWCAITNKWYLGWEHAGVDEGWLISDDNDIINLAYDATLYAHYNLNTRHNEL